MTVGSAPQKGYWFLLGPTSTLVCKNATSGCGNAVLAASAQRMIKQQQEMITVIVRIAIGGIANHPV